MKLEKSFKGQTQPSALKSDEYGRETIYKSRASSGKS